MGDDAARIEGYERRVVELEALVAAQAETIERLHQLNERLEARVGELEQVWNHPASRRYERMAIFRPMVAVGRQELGYLPGTLDEKLDPWMGAIHDAVVAMSDGRRKAAADETLAQITAEGRLTMESVTYLRGRSLHGTWVLMDEAQNLEPSLAKTVLTRAAEGTKVVFTGDTSQIDVPFLSAENNAMSVLTAALGGGRGGSFFGHVRLTQGERSPMATMAAALL